MRSNPAADRSDARSFRCECGNYRDERGAVHARWTETRQTGAAQSNIDRVGLSVTLQPSVLVRRLQTAYFTSRVNPYDTTTRDRARRFCLWFNDLESIRPESGAEKPVKLVAAGRRAPELDALTIDPTLVLLYSAECARQAASKVPRAVRGKPVLTLLFLFTL